MSKRPFWNKQKWLNKIIGFKFLETIKVYKILVSKHKSSCPEVFCKKGVLGNLAKFTGKQLPESLF